MIYFMQAEQTGLVKIGYSSDVVTRKKQLESEYGTLTILAVVPHLDRDDRSQLSLQDKARYNDETL